jgi:hypothetical protein
MEDLQPLPGPGETLDPENIVQRDLSDDPPEGWPKLSKKSAALVKHRAAAILSGDPVTWAASRAAAGMHTKTRIVPEVRRYCEAMAQHGPGGSKDPADLRSKTVDRLARIVQHGDDREASVAAKVLEQFLPKARPDETEVLKNVGDTELLARLDHCLSEMRDQGLGDFLRLSLEDTATYEDLPFPGEGSVVGLIEEGNAPDPSADRSSGKPENRTSNSS